jgi:hypothetical protein
MKTFHELCESLILQGDWQEDFWGAKGRGYEEYI